MADASGQSLVYTAKTTDCGRHGASRHRNGRSDARDRRAGSPAARPRALRR